MTARQNAAARPAAGVFATNRSTKQTDQDRYKKWSRREFGIELEVVDLNELAVDLESDALYRVAENDLVVRPRKPRVLQPVAVFRERQESLLPGFGAPLVGREAEMGELQDALARGRQPGGARIVVIEGPAGVGKTRLAVDASNAAATTIVAAPGTEVTADSLADVSLDGPSVVVADDAHRSPDLSGLAAMLGDPRFDSVTVVLTVAAGSAAGVLARWGLDRARAVAVPLGGLGRKEIGQIVAGHGFTAQAFRSHVAAVAQGSPWLAHAACLIAAERRIFSWRDTAELLGQLVDRRLRQAGIDSDEHRAAAVALALLTTVNEGRELAVLAGAVTALPHDAHRLDILLEDLAPAENLIHAGGSRCMGDDDVVRDGGRWGARATGERCGMVIDRAAATGLSRYDECVRAAAAAADEQRGQRRGDPCAAPPALGPAAAARSGQGAVHPG
jgi:hypothetical protein